MVEVTINNKQWYLDGYLVTNLDKAKKVIKKDWDMLFIVDGPERSGKSCFAQQIAAYCDPTICLDRIVFTPDQFEKAVLNAKPGQAIIWDEAITGGDSSGAVTNVWKSLKKMLVQMGQKNLYVFIIIHSFFDLNKYLALWRSRALIHIYHDKFDRGFFEFYNEERKKFLYIKGKKFYEYKLGHPNFRGRFKKGYWVNEQEYREKKEVSLAQADDDEKTNRYEEHYLALINHIIETQNTNAAALHKMFQKRLKNPFSDVAIREHIRKAAQYE